MSNFRKANRIKDKTSYDAGLVFDDGNVYGSGTTTSKVSSSAFQFDFLDSNQGSNRPLITLNWNIDAIESDTGDEIYTILIEQSDDVDFGSIIPVTKDIDIPRGTTVGGNAITAANPLSIAELVQVLYRHLRTRYIVAGTIATGLSISDGWQSPG